MQFNFRAIGLSLFLFVFVIFGGNIFGQSVQFDAINLVECRDVTPDDFAHANPNELLVEAIFSISAFSNDESFSNTDLIYQIYSPQRSVRVFDYLPTTSVATDYAGNISLNELKEKNRGLGINASGIVGEVVNLSANTNFSNKNSTTKSYQKLPPMQLLSSSGTMERGSGVYFKLKPSSQTTLEGSKDFAVKFRVPRAWRADAIQLHCRARYRAKGQKSFRRVGTADYLVALYLAGNTSGKKLATQLVQQEDSLRKFRKQTPQKLTNHFQVSFSKPKPKVDWFYEVVFDQTPKTLPKCMANADRRLQIAARNFALAKTYILNANQ